MNCMQAVGVYPSLESFSIGLQVFREQRATFKVTQLYIPHKQVVLTRRERVCMGGGGGGRRERRDKLNEVVV